MSAKSEMKFHGLGPVGLKMVVSHLHKHSSRKHVLSVKGPDGDHHIIAQPGRVREAEAALTHLVKRPNFLHGVYRGEVKEL